MTRDRMNIEQNEKNKTHELYGNGYATLYRLRKSRDRSQEHKSRIAGKWILKQQITLSVWRNNRKIEGKHEISFDTL